MKFLNIIARLLEGALNVINKYEAKKARSNPATTIANNDNGVQQSNKSFSDLADKSKRDIPK